MISESGKLFKEMERQTKQKFDDIDVKLTEFTYNVNNLFYPLLK